MPATFWAMSPRIGPRITARVGAEARRGGQIRLPLDINGGFHHSVGNLPLAAVTVPRGKDATDDKEVIPS